MLFCVYLLIQRPAVLSDGVLTDGILAAPVRGKLRLFTFACCQSCGNFNTFSNKSQRKNARKGLVGFLTPSLFY